MDLLADDLPEPVGGKRQQDPGHQGPEQHDHHQQNPSGNGGSLGQGLRPIGHEAPAGNQGHGNGQGSTGQAKPEGAAMARGKTANVA